MSRQKRPVGDNIICTGHVQIHVTNLYHQRLTLQCFTLNCEIRLLRSSGMVWPLIKMPLPASVLFRFEQKERGENLNRPIEKTV